MAKRGRPPKNKSRGKTDAPAAGSPKSGPASARSETGRFISRSEAGSKVGRPRKRAYDAPGVVLFDLPALNLTSVQSATRPMRSAAPVQFEEWTDTQLSGLRSELDSLLASTRALGKKLGGEMDYMGVTMKNCTDTHLKALLESDISTDELRSSTNNKRGRGASKFNSKRSRRDSTVAVTEDEEMTDINVVDVDDSANANSVPVPDDVSEPDLNSSYDSVSTGRARNNRKKAGRPSKGRDRKKKKRKTEEVSSSEDDYVRQPTTSANFWQSISPFSKTLTVADLLPLKPQSLSDSDPDFVIPPLGTHYSETLRDSSWTAANNAAKASGRGGSSFDGGDVRCGDVTQRILAALIEEKLIVEPNTPADPFLATSALPLDSPPTADYSRPAMLSLDDRIRMELRSIGLLDDEDANASGNREDDEICAEIRHLQGQLREQIRVNNERRRIFLRRAELKMNEQQGTNAKRAENKAIEQLFLRRMKLKAKIKKKKGRPPRTKPTRSSTAAAAAAPETPTAGKSTSGDPSKADTAVPPPVNG
eukprot:CAMPEP_0114626102 /NCGR_PEP_ID=MMETSP0168-20121206/11607_1 /TAXON_ID=95228 ORGANISM="Vannella sp., Strain DIVA3 517/6/12" /NCGR_SAMPLE_ID=MMETSP0168 /ASSEMBLY_ACC=CAM_ASM_000044 /LENGTH=534 /DNA_ID=CAMNT_0001837393 /DNA_START=172 /DNA_END=1773 /DNA_ORIENTATION=+